MSGANSIPCPKPRMVKNGELDSIIVEAPSEQFTKIAKVFGFTALAIGLLTIAMIVYSIFFVYNNTLILIIFTIFNLF